MVVRRSAYRFVTEWTSSAQWAQRYYYYYDRRIDCGSLWFTSARMACARRTRLTTSEHVQNNHKKANKTKRVHRGQSIISHRYALYGIKADEATFLWLMRLNIHMFMWSTASTIERMPPQRVRSRCLEHWAVSTHILDDQKYNNNPINYCVISTRNALQPNTNWRQNRQRNLLWSHKKMPWNVYGKN